jgi:hypothetical protein
VVSRSDMVLACYFRSYCDSLHPTLAVGTSLLHDEYRTISSGLSGRGVALTTLPFSVEVNNE